MVAWFYWEYPASRYRSVPWQGPSFWTLMSCRLRQACRSSLHRLLYCRPSVPHTCSILSSQDWTHPQVGRWVLGLITQTWGGVQGRSLHRSEGEVTHSIKLHLWIYTFKILNKPTLTPPNSNSKDWFKTLSDWCTPFNLREKSHLITPLNTLCVDCYIQ